MRYTSAVVPPVHDERAQRDAGAKCVHARGCPAALHAQVIALPCWWVRRRRRRPGGRRVGVWHRAGRVPGALLRPRWVGGPNSRHCEVVT